MLLFCHQLHHTQQLSATEWLRARSLLQARDERAMALWQRWKCRLAHSRQRSVREESEQYWLDEEDREQCGPMEEAADQDNEEHVEALRALLAVVMDEADDTPEQHSGKVASV